MAHKLTGRKTLVILLASFGLVLGVNGYMVAKAIATYTGEDSDSAYLQGANYNRTLARRAEQERLGWRASITAEKSANGSVEVIVHVVAADRRPVGALRLSGVLRHPSDAKRDRGLTFKELRQGTYASGASNLTPGGWDVVVESTRPDEPFEATRRIWLR